MKKIILTILLIVAVAGVSGGGVYLWQNSKVDIEKQILQSQISQLQIQKLTKSNTNEQKNLKSYTNNKFGFSFEYPVEWGDIEESTFSNTFSFPSEEVKNKYLKGEQYSINFSNKKYEMMIFFNTTDFGYPSEIVSVPFKQDVSSAFPTLNFAGNDSGAELYLSKPIIFDESIGFSPTTGIQQKAIFYKDMPGNIYGIEILNSIGLLKDTKLQELINNSLPIENEAKYFPYGPADANKHYVLDETNLRDESIKKQLEQFEDFVNSFKFTK